MSVGVVIEYISLVVIATVPTGTYKPLFETQLNTLALLVYMPSLSAEVVCANL